MTPRLPDSTVGLTTTGNESRDRSDSGFVVAGTLLAGKGLLCEFVLRKVKSWNYRLLLLAGILFALFIIWAELAVGLIGTPLAGS